jgi:hypothetical protein
MIISLRVYGKSFDLLLAWQHGCILAWRARLDNYWGMTVGQARSKITDWLRI